MKTTELQDSIIQKVLNSNDDQLLNFLNQILSNDSEREAYKLSDFEKRIIEESKADYLSGKTISNEDIISRNKEWLNE